MNKLNDIENFILYCLESYRSKTNKSGKEALIDFENYEVFNFLEKSFEVLHTQSMDYIIDDIISYMENKK